MGQRMQWTEDYNPLWSMRITSEECRLNSVTGRKQNTRDPVSVQQNNVLITAARCSLLHREEVPQKLSELVALIG